MGAVFIRADSLTGCGSRRKLACALRAPPRGHGNAEREHLRHRDRQPHAGKPEQLRQNEQHNERQHRLGKHEHIRQRSLFRRVEVRGRHAHVCQQRQRRQKQRQPGADAGIRLSRRAEERADDAARKKERGDAHRRDAEGRTVSARDGAAQLAEVARAIGPADQRLAAVADALQQHIDRRQHVVDAAVDRDRQRPAVVQQEVVHDHKRDVRRERQPDRRGRDLQQRAPQRQHRARLRRREAHAPPHKIADGKQHRCRLTDDGRPCAAGHAPVKPPHEQVVERDVGHKARAHRDHGERRAAEIADEGHEAGRQDLKGRAAGDHADVLRGQRARLILRTEHRQHRTEQPEQRRREHRARHKQQQHRAGKARARRLLLPARLQNGAADRTGKADARADSLQQRRRRIGERDGGETEVAERLADEKPVHDRVQAGERKRKHGREHIGREGVMPDRLHLITSVSFSKIRLNSAIASIISCTRASPMRAKTVSSSA